MNDDLIIGRWRSGPMDNDPIIGRWRDDPGETDEEREEREFLEYHRERQRGALLPNIEAGAIQMTSGMAGLAQRVTGGLLGDPEETARYARAAAQAAEEEAAKPGKVLPPVIARGVRSVTGTMPTQVLAGLTGGPPAMIALATSQEMNQAVFEGKGAGLKGVGLAAHVISQGAVEAIPATIMSKAGRGGFEAVFGKGASKAVTRGIRAGLKKVGIRTIDELIEENITEVGHNAVSAVFDIDPEAVTLGRIGKTVTDTTVATLMQMGLAGAPGVARAAVARGGPAVAPREPQVAPSRAEWLARNRERLMAETQPQAAPGAVQEDTGGEPAQMALPGMQVALDKPAAEPATEGEGFSLTKKRVTEVRKIMGLPEIPEAGRESWPMVGNRVVESGLHNDAMNIARSVVTEPRSLSTDESMALLLKADEVESQRLRAVIERADATAKGNRGAWAIATEKHDSLVEQMEVLMRGSVYGKRETARALSISQLIIHRGRNDLPSLLSELQAVQKPGVRVSEKQTQAATDWVDSYAKALEDMAATEETIQIEDEAKEAGVAQRAIVANKPRGQAGKRIRKKALSEREDIKKRLRAMGHQIHDVSQVSVEGTYLIGRLGLTYIKEGTGTLAEVLERLRADMPDLKLTQGEVNRALIQRSPKSQTQMRSEAKKRKSKLLSLARMEVEAEDMANGIATKAKKREPVDAEVAAFRKKLAKLRDAYFYTDIEAAKKERAIQTINRLQDDLANGITNQKRNPKVISPELASLHEKARKLRSESRINEDTKRIQEQMRTGIFPEPEVKERKPEDPRLQVKRIKLRKLRKEKEQMIKNAGPWTKMRVTEEVFAVQKALRGTADVSFTFRQNIAQVLAHPMATTKKFFRSLEALGSEDAADKIADEIEESHNYTNYQISKLAILDHDSARAQQRSEVFTGTLAEKMPLWGKVVKASGRHAVAIGNLVRVQAFDRYMHNNSNATIEEMQAFADIANKSTGIGDISKLGASVKFWTMAFYSPKFVASRIQTPLLLLKYWKLPRVRKEIAKEMVRAMGTAGTVMGLLSLVPGVMVKFPWEDPEDPDWMKIRVGNTRIDMFGGFQQPARLLLRLASVPWRGEGGIARQDPMELIGRFAAFKLSPTITMVAELATGRTAVGEEVSRVETLARQLMPFVLEDIEDAWKIEGSAGAVAIAPLVLLGVGASTYYDSETRVRAKFKKLWQAGQITKARRVRDEHNRRNPDDKIVTIKVGGAPRK